MLQNIQRLVPLTAQLRALSISAALAKKAPTSLRTLKSALTKERTALAKMERDYLRAQEKLAKTKAALAERKLLQQATKPPKRMSALNLYIQEHCSPDMRLGEVSSNFRKLAPYEREQYETKAQEINDERARIFTPRPKAPLSGYNAFLKETWEDVGSFGESARRVSANWKNLSEEEKASYNASEADKEAYKKDLALWVEYRIKVHNETTAKTA